MHKKNKKTKTSPGFSLVEFAMVLSISMAGISAATIFLNGKIDHALAKASASHIEEVGFALISYISKNQYSLISSPSPYTVLTVSSANGNIGLKELNFLNPNIPDKNPWGSDYKISITRKGSSPPFILDAIIVTSAGLKINGDFRNDISGDAAQLVKMYGGSTDEILTAPGNFRAAGNKQSWIVNESDFPGLIKEPAQLAFFYSSSWAGAVDATYLPIDGSKPMSGNLNLKNNDINNYSVIASNTAAFSKNLGTDKIVASDRFNADSVYSSGDVNANNAVVLSSTSADTCDIGTDSHHPTCWREKSSGCFTGPSMVSMSDGTQKSISDVRIGDSVMNRDGSKANKVLYVEILTKKMKLYSPVVGMEPFATLNHPLEINGALSVPSTLATDIYAWLKVKELSKPFSLSDGTQDPVYNLWTDGDFTYIINGFSTTSIIGDTRFVVKSINLGYISNDQVNTLIEFLSHSPDTLYGFYLVKNLLGDINIDVLDRFISQSAVKEMESKKYGLILNSATYIGRFFKFLKRTTNLNSR